MKNHDRLPTHFFLLRIYFLFAICNALFSLSLTAQQASEFPFTKHTKRVLFLGNSITYAGTYITDIETYFITHYPKERIEFINEGLPSETVSGLSEPNHADGKFPRPDLHERLARVLAITKPDVVFACYGMNDGIYMPLNEERFKAYQDGMHWLHDELEKTDAQQIVFLTPPVHDDPQLGTKGYNLVLDKYSQWLLEQEDSSNWKVADIHFPMTKYLEKERANNPAFKLADDGVHPGDLGHWLMAKAVLLYLDQPVRDHIDMLSSINTFPHAKAIYDLVSERQKVMKDAWLSAAGHKRPGMNEGIPLTEARQVYDSIEVRIEALLKLRVVADNNSSFIRRSFTDMKMYTAIVPGLFVWIRRGRAFL
ncbi:MAG: SGNH/GDSL hydrolase family protein [Ginsengibacter sp.]